MHPAVGAGGELNFWNERGAEWHRSSVGKPQEPFVAAENPAPEFFAKRRQTISACCAGLRRRRRE